MKRFIFFIALIVSIFSLSSCANQSKKHEIEGTGSYLTEEYTSYSGTALTIGNIQIRKNASIIPVNVVLTKGDTPKISVTAQKEILKTLSISDVLGTVTISGLERYYYKTDIIIIRIEGYTFSDLKFELSNVTVESTELIGDYSDIVLTKASKFHINTYEGRELNCVVSDASTLSMDSVKAEKLKTTVSMNSSVEIAAANVSESILTLQDASTADIKELYSKSISIDAQDASICKAEGESSNIDLVFSGGSKYEGKDLVVDMATIVISGNSHLTLTSSKGINVIATGQSEVVYYGDATVTQTSITGQSKITRGE